MASKKKATPEASIGQRVFVARITGVNNEGTFLSAVEADKIISEFVFARDVKALMRGKVVRSGFKAQAKRLYDWASTDKKAPEITVRKAGKGWEFVPAGASKGGLFD